MKNNNMDVIYRLLTFTYIMIFISIGISIFVFKTS